MADRSAELWSDYEAAIAPTADAALRVRARMNRVLAARTGPRVAADDRAPAEPASRAAAAILVLKSSALAVTIAAAALGSLHLGARAIAPAPELADRSPAVRDEPPTDPRGDAGEPPAALPAATVPEPMPAEAIAPPLQRPQEQAPVRRVPSSGDTTAATPRADRLAEELELIEPARRALARGDEATALRLFGEHGQKFPAGALAPERDAYSAIARCKHGAADRATELDRFARTHPGSSLLDRVRDACGKSPTDSTKPTE